MVEEREVDLREYVIGGLRIVRRNLIWIVGVTAIISVGSYIHLRNLPDSYESIALILPAKVSDGIVEKSDLLRILFKNPLNPYLTRIAKRLGMKEEAGIGLIGSFKIKDTEEYIEIRTHGSTPEGAKKLADLLCEMILERQNNLMEVRSEIANDEINYLSKQIISVEKEIKQLNKRISRKEKTDILAGSYVFQSLITSREYVLKRRDTLQSGLREKKIKLKYYTKPARIIAEASLLKNRMPVEKKAPFFTIMIVCFLALVFLSLIIDYFRKTPSLQK